MVGLLGLPIALFTGGFSYIFLIFVVASFFLSWPIFFIIHLSGGSMVNVLYGLRQPTSKREQLQGDYQRAKCLMAENKFTMAHKVIDEVLEKDTNYADALLLKAQILQRMGRLVAAKGVIYTILRNCKQDAVNCRWAHSILVELNEQIDDLGIVENQ